MRNPTEHSADNDMQMQRWFGYRGSEIVLSRVVCFNSQLSRLINYHRDDTSARIGYVSANSPEDFMNVLVRQGRDYKATLKVTGGGNARLQGIMPPRSQPWTFLLGETIQDFRINANKIGDFLGSEPEEIIFEDKIYGWIKRGVTSEEMADFIDDFNFDSHKGDRNSWKVWSDIKQRFMLQSRCYLPMIEDEELEQSLPSGDKRPKSEYIVRYSPHRISAYMRFWHLMHRARPRATPLEQWLDPENSPHWSSAQIEQKKPPLFNLVLRKSINEDGHLDFRVNPGVAKRDRKSGSRWGSRGEGSLYPGDQLIDFTDVPKVERPERGGLRRIGDPGLVLFQPAQDDDGDYIQMGVIFPRGGPVIRDLIGINENEGE